MAETCWNTIVVSSEAFERAFSISLGFLQVEDPIKPTDGFPSVSLYDQGSNGACWCLAIRPRLKCSTSQVIPRTSSWAPWRLCLCNPVTTAIHQNWENRVASLFKIRRREIRKKKKRLSLRRFSITYHLHIYIYYIYIWYMRYMYIWLYIYIHALAICMHLLYHSF